MPTLKNPKHELFARLLSEGNSQKDAYTGAGFKFNAGGATRLAHRDEMLERIGELKAQRFALAVKNRDADSLPAEIPDNAVSLLEMGLDLMWVVRSYKTIYDEARDACQFAPANKAIESIHKLIIAEQGGVDPETAPSVDTDRIPVKAMTEMLREIRLIGDGQVIVVDPADIAKDVTPARDQEPEGTIRIVDPPKSTVPEDMNEE